MRKALRENALCASAAGAACAAMAWIGLYGFAWNDYDNEARPAYEALLGGHVGRFLALAPAYGGSLVERAPFAFAPGLWGGGPLAVYRMIALPCLLALAALAVWLAARMRAAGSTALARGIVVGVCAANPIALSAIEQGHAEELLGACLCVAAVLVARGSERDPRRGIWAGALLGLAIANKEWALLAAGPVLLALAPGRRLACALLTAGIAAAFTLPFVLAPAAGASGGHPPQAFASQAIFQPWQVWWFLGSHGPLLHAAFGIPLHGYRSGPGWTQTLSHPLIVLVGLGLALALWLMGPRDRAVQEREALLALALAMLLRCMLDTWDIGYYMLPFLLTLLAWEAVKPAQRLPLIALATVLVPWICLQRLSAGGIGPDAQAAIFLAWTLPLSLALGMSLFAPRRLGARFSRPPGAGTPAGAQGMTVSSLERLVRTS